MRETLITTTLDAEPIQCLRVPGPSFATLVAAAFTGGVFILPVYHLYWPALACGLGGLAAILYWLWTGTAEIPEKDEKAIGHGHSLPLYLSGPRSVGWWAVFITMLGDATAFASLVFGYFFFWTIHDDFPPDPATAGPGLLWPSLATAALLIAWATTLGARELNRAGAAGSTARPAPARVAGRACRRWRCCFGRPLPLGSIPRRTSIPPSSGCWSCGPLSTPASV